MGDSSTVVTGQKTQRIKSGLNFKGNGVPERVGFSWQFCFAEVRDVIGKRCDPVIWNRDIWVNEVENIKFCGGGSPLVAEDL